MVNTLQDLPRGLSEPRECKAAPPARTAGHPATWGSLLPSEWRLRQPHEKSFWSGRTADERSKWADEMFIAYPTVEGILLDAFKKMKIAHSAMRFETILVAGETGAGKSRLASEIEYHVLAMFEGPPPPDQTLKRVIQLTIPTPCNSSEFMTQILLALGDPFPRKRAKGDLREVTADLLRKCGVLMILIDNVQDIPAKRAARGVDQILVALREMMDDSYILWVLLGTDDAIRVVRSEKQTLRRVPYWSELKYFSLSSLAQRKLYLKLLHEIDKWLPICHSLDLKAYAGRIHIATEGIFGRIILLMDKAWREAVARGSEEISSEDLYNAFNLEHGRPDDESNPFSHTFVMRRLRGPSDPYEELHS